MAIVEALDVRKTYRRRGKPPKAALDGFDLVVEAGGVHGFLGPNGSGKTTMLRCLLGLARADSGSMKIIDRPFLTICLTSSVTLAHCWRAPRSFPRSPGVTTSVSWHVQRNFPLHASTKCLTKSV